jgi:hypothetical protein
MAEQPWAEVRKVVDNYDKLQERLAALTAMDVLIGIPAAKAQRKPVPGESNPVTNSELARIHEFGSPAHNIPARPFLFPGVKRIRPKAMPMFRQAALAALNESTQAAMRILTQIGILGRNSVINEITHPQPAYKPLKPATIRARLRRTQAGRRQLKRLQTQAKSAGMATGQVLQDWGSSPTAGGELFIQPLLDTLQMRNAITYVVRYNPRSGRSNMLVAAVEQGQRASK